MHEMSLINDLMRKITGVAEAHGARRIVGLKVELGALSHLSAGHFREHFLEAAAGTPAAGAQLDIVEMTDIHDAHAQDILLRSVEVAADDT
jgi:hydrogenase nickel incorporation protein HypA/HybF